MIKLNNKNITYVALADSSNSLKAPKEIWYADSSNSVKLVYRRKDALIEGEDYEKYHWLVGDADAYINTLKYYRPYDDSVQMTFRDNLYPNRESKNNKHNVEEQIWGGGVKRDGLTIRSYISGTTDIRIGNNIINKGNSSVNWFGYTTNEHINDSEFHNLYISNVTDNKYSFTYNGSQKGNLSTINTLPEVVQGDVLVFVSNEQPGGYFNGSFFNFIHYRNNVEITHLTPCKLLKPVPKWLDANGIRRQVGECGMIDLVSGKFYGNVNSSGTFTVENYYERKEWLQGRNGAYIDTMHPLTTIDDAMRVHAHYDGVTKNPLGNEQAICGVVEDYTDNSKIWAYIYIGADSNSNAYQRGLYRIGSYGQQVDSVNSLEFTSSIYIDGNNSVFTKNSGVSSVSSNGVTKKILGNVYLFSRNTMAQPSLAVERYFQGDIASFQIGDPTFTTLSVNMIPCTLTMDLPASMDANNIARTKGTSGMWDLVSDKFYGNVANSGTFKAVNLAEGVDYEVHDWLVGDNVAYIQGVRYNLWNNHLQMNIGKIQDSDLKSDLRYFYYSQNNNYFIVDTQRYEEIKYRLRIRYRENAGEGHVGDITPYSSMPNSLIIDFYIENGRGYVERNGETFVENTTFSQGNWTSINPRIYSFKMSYIREVLPDSTYKSNLIPVKLLKSIPSKYDANGIARQAGECGMYDTVNDVFYGNVASSGSFTVSDN